jgi:hypothetical protein
MTSCLVFLPRSHGFDPVRHRLDQAPDVVVIEVGETMPAPESLAGQKPPVVLLAQSVAWSAAGWQFVERFRLLSPDSEIRVLPLNEIASSKLLQMTPDAPAAGALRAASFTLHRVPARRSARRRVSQGTTAVVNGRNAFLVDISTLGAQVLTPVLLKPGQQVSFSLTSSGSPPRVRGSVAWSLYELKGPGGLPHYRAGIGFHTQLLLDENVLPQGSESLR